MVRICSNTIVSFWEFAYFQGRTVSLRECSFWKRPKQPKTLALGCFKEILQDFHHFVAGVFSWHAMVNTLTALAMFRKIPTADDTLDECKLGSSRHQQKKITKTKHPKTNQEENIHPWKLIWYWNIRMFNRKYIDSHGKRSSESC